MRGSARLKHGECPLGDVLVGDMDHGPEESGLFLVGDGLLLGLVGRLGCVGWALGHGSSPLGYWGRLILGTRRRSSSRAKTQSASKASSRPGRFACLCGPARCFRFADCLDLAPPSRHFDGPAPRRGGDHRVMRAHAAMKLHRDGPEPAIASSALPTTPACATARALSPREDCGDLAAALQRRSKVGARRWLLWQ